MKTHRKNHWVKDVLAGICLSILLMMPGMAGADVTVYHEESGYWYIQLSDSSYSLSTQKFGDPGYTPVR